MSKKHLERIRSDEVSTKKSRKTAIRRSITTVAIICGILLFAKVYASLSSATAEENPNTGATVTLAPVGEEADRLIQAQMKENKDDIQLPWNLVLVSEAQPLSQSFTLDLETVPGGRIDTRIAQPLRDMQAAAQMEGIELKLTSSYRNVPKQKTLYQQEIAKYRRMGYSEEESRSRTGHYIQPPGCSEHHTGLALDLITPSYQKLDAGFANTEAARWLKEHGPEFGFILRYPEGKEEITGIYFEPWHYRYVGVEDAKAIQEAGVCLEEYLETLVAKE